MTMHAPTRSPRANRTPACVTCRRSSSLHHHHLRRLLSPGYPSRPANKPTHQLARLEAKQSLGAERPPNANERASHTLLCNPSRFLRSSQCRVSISRSLLRRLWFSFRPRTTARLLSNDKTSTASNYRHLLRPPPLRPLLTMPSMTTSTYKQAPSTCLTRACSSRHRRWSWCPPLRA